MSLIIKKHDKYSNEHLYIYEIDEKDREEAYKNISCYLNKLFIENYHQYHIAQCENFIIDSSGNFQFKRRNPKETIDAVCDYLPLKGFLPEPSIHRLDINQANNYANNIKFVEELDALLNTKTFNDCKSSISERSTNLFKGFKHYLIDNRLKVGGDENGPIDTDICTTISTPYYNSTSTNLYKGCLYGHQYPYTQNTKKFGHLFIIEADDDAKCIDYIKSIKSRYIEQDIKEIQSDPNNKYIYEQEVLFKRYSVFKDIEYKGQIKKIEISPSIVTDDNADVKDLTLDIYGKIYTTKKGNLIAQTKKIVLNREEFDLSNYKINASQGEFNHLINLDILNEGGLDNFIDTYVYTCKLSDIVSSDQTGVQTGGTVTKQTDVAIIKKGYEYKDINALNNIEFEIILYKNSQKRLNTSDIIYLNSNTIYIFSVEKIVVCTGKYQFEQFYNGLVNLTDDEHPLRENCALFKNSSIEETKIDIYFLCINYEIVGMQNIANDLTIIQKYITFRAIKPFILYYNTYDNKLQHFTSDNLRDNIFLSSNVMEEKEISEYNRCTVLINLPIARRQPAQKYIQPLSQGGGNYNSKYHAKYLKYKIKYLELKNNL